MKTTTRNFLHATWAGALLALLSCLACDKPSETVEDGTAGMNGGFERAEEGLPVNWLVYSPDTIPTGDYDLVFDREDFKEGEQSLRFDVRECSNAGGRLSPGITQEYPVPPGDYRVGFWIKSDGSDYVVSAGGVSAKTGEMAPIATPQGQNREWQHVERVVRVPPQHERLRFELSIRSPGELWIDGVTIEPVQRSAR